ncbi:putative pentatricopeptide repeat-containing protein, mitochondrial [Vitis vinifera]|uniref:Putative pentatricopeptide repeat-containing protein, mitochondrial n=1 Tax=Vitis vinifera TaxID=29760 RepID=A0A438D061_VITVI|nr:putative pentatricopeptide repeat-containing protein, mitochondrial [Vitis vinifera]
MKKRKVVDAKVYGIIINGYLRRNDIPKAFDLLQTMTESDYLPTISTYTKLMQHLFRLNENQKCCKLYDEILERGVEPDSVAITTMVAVFIKELYKISRTDEVIKVLNEMQASKIIIGDEDFSTSMDWCLIEEALEKCIVKFTSQLVVEILRNCSLHGHAALLFFS